MKKRILAVTLICIICISYITSGCAAGSGDARPESFSLSKSERAYLEGLRGKPLKLAYSYEVIANRTVGGKFYGMYIPILDMLENVFGLTVKLVKLDWDMVTDALDSGGADIYGLVSPVNKRWQKYYSSAAVYKSPAQIISRIARPLNSLGELKGSTVGVLVNSLIAGTMENYVEPEGEIIYYPTISEMFNALERGDIACAATVGNVETDLLLRPGLINEFTIENLYTEQGLVSPRNDLLPLLRLIDRYMEYDTGFKGRVLASRRDALLAFEQRRFAEDVAYLNENTKLARVFSSGMLYPLCYVENGVYKGMQIEINEIFTALTGVPIIMETDQSDSSGFFAAPELVEAGDYMAAGVVYFNPEKQKDENFAYSIPLWKDVIRSYSYNESVTAGRDMVVGSTPDGALYIDWPTMTDTQPLLYNSRRDVVGALKSGRLDVAFLSEMCSNYLWLIEKNYSMLEADFVSASAEMHLLYSSQNASYNRMYDEAIRLYRVIYPTKAAEWEAQSGRHKIDDLRMRQLWQNTYIAVGAVSSIFFILLFYLLYKYTTYDKQISKLIRTQQTFDLAWVNLKKNTLTSKGNFTLFRAWGLEILDKPKHNIADLSKAFGWDLTEDYNRDMDEMRSCNLAFIVNDRSVVSPIDQQPRYYRRFLHRLSNHEFMSCLQDVTSDVSKERELAQIASTDYLSKLLTRRAMHEKITAKCEELKETGSPAFIVMVDLDDFKDVNDTYGHDVGDKALIGVSEIIQTTEGCENAVSRWGGDEFLIMLECEDSKTAGAWVNSIVERVRNSSVAISEKSSVKLTISAGVARLNPFTDYTVSVARADEALYRAKRAGKNCMRIME